MPFPLDDGGEELGGVGAGRGEGGLIGAGAAGLVWICDVLGLWPPFTTYPSVNGRTEGPLLTGLFAIWLSRVALWLIWELNIDIV